MQIVNNHTLPRLIFFEEIKYFYVIYLHLNIFYYLCTRKSELLTTKMRMWRNW